MPFYDDLAARYGMPGMNVSPGLAQEMFASGISNIGNRMMQAGMSGNPAMLGQGPMAGDVINQMREAEWKRQQLLQEIQRKEEIQAFEQMMAQKQFEISEAASQLNQDKFAYGMERDLQKDALAREQMGNQREVAEIYRRPQTTAKPDPMTDPNVVSAMYRWAQGDRNPEDAVLLRAVGVLTNSEFGSLGAPQQSDLNKWATGEIRELRLKLAANPSGREAEGIKSQIRSLEGQINSETPGAFPILTGEDVGAANQAAVGEAQSSADLESALRDEFEAKFPAATPPQREAMKQRAALVLAQFGMSQSEIDTWLATLEPSRLLDGDPEEFGD